MEVELMMKLLRCLKIPGEMSYGVCPGEYPGVKCPDSVRMS